jgi:predicted glycosyltransferase
VFLDTVHYLAIKEYGQRGDLEAVVSRIIITPEQELTESLHFLKKYAPDLILSLREIVSVYKESQKQSKAEQSYG